MTTDEGAQALRLMKALVRRLGTEVTVTDAEIAGSERWELLVTHLVEGGLTLRVVPPPIVITRQ